MGLPSIGLDVRSSRWPGVWLPTAATKKQQSFQEPMYRPMQRQTKSVADPHERGRRQLGNLAIAPFWISFWAVESGAPLGHSAADCLMRRHLDPTGGYKLVHAVEH